jgi:hypothetical protein
MHCLAAASGGSTLSVCLPGISHWPHWRSDNTLTVIGTETRQQVRALCFKSKRQASTAEHGYGAG